MRLDVRWLITSDVSSIPKKVSRYCVSLTDSDMRGGTKKKSNAATDRNDCSTPGPRPSRTAENTTPSRYSITRLVRSSRSATTLATTVIAAQIAAAYA
ncbi:hypothetical protein FEP69_05666 [Burkholderia multivorans]|nr:hypothetical protein [Burkholderia multivorans]